MTFEQALNVKSSFPNFNEAGSFICIFPLEEIAHRQFLSCLIDVLLANTPEEIFRQLPQLLENRAFGFGLNGEYNVYYVKQKTKNSFDLTPVNPLF